MDKFQAIKKASILGMAGNLLLLIIKGLVGFLTNSQSMIADAMNSAGDIVSSIMTFIGNKIASQPRDEDHNLGHGKAEYIYSMFISIVMGLMALETFKSAVLSLFSKGHYHFSIWLIIVCLLTILMKLFLYLYTYTLNKKYHNLLIEANAKDHRNDCLITFGNLVACLLSFFGIYFVDGIVGILIALWILGTAIKIFQKSYDVLMDKSMSDVAKEKVYAIIEKHEDIKKVAHFNATPVGYQYQISLTIYVDGNLSTFESHAIANRLEKEIIQNISEIYLAVIHVNPLDNIVSKNRSSRKVKKRSCKQKVTS